MFTLTWKRDCSTVIQDEKHESRGSAINSAVDQMGFLDIPSMEVYSPDDIMVAHIVLSVDKQFIHIFKTNGDGSAWDCGMIKV